MAMEEVADVSQWSQNFSPEQILNGNLEAFQALFYLIIMISIYSVAIYKFYRYVARRDVFKPNKIKNTKFICLCKYFFLFPFVAGVFFVGFSLILIALTEKASSSILGISSEIESILALAFAIIITIRITAYYTEDLSKDVAKMLPFAVLGVFLVDSSYFSIGKVMARISTLPDHVNTVAQFLILIILVEWILRISLFIKNKIIPGKETKTCEI